MAELHTLTIAVTDVDGKEYACTVKKFPSIVARDAMREPLREGKVLTAAQIWALTDWIEGDREIQEHEHLMAVVCEVLENSYTALSAAVKKN